ncbi:MULTISPECIES: glycosyltransferase family 2 protein [Hwangdonia]|uniref:Glycosyltransferase family 2 protein n=1 Tax=Hwangdonia seohaensis TaxID=1240727 RepID=A0ABW3RFF6_9FLAO|nr:glycosyltransferase [Hwangdonia seohaensis]
MLSILIPTYNYDIVHLVNDIHEQATKSNIEFEIIALDDVSNADTIKQNSKINVLKHTRYLVSKTNGGIAVNRQLLCDKAKFDWILLLDADMKLKDPLFISNYIDAIERNYEVIFGGIKYENEAPDSKILLRWKYGVHCEAIDAKKRNKTPYKITSAANMLIKKEVYKRFGLNSIGHSYGMDIFFGPQLKINNIPVLHINNEVFHLGLESSKTYLKKTRLAVETLLRLNHTKKIKLHENDLLKIFVLSKKTMFNYALSLFFKLFENTMTKNLLGKSPSIKLLQLYKIAYMCHFDLEKE